MARRRRDSLEPRKEHTHARALKSTSCATCKLKRGPSEAKGNNIGIQNALLSCHAAKTAKASSSKPEYQSGKAAQRLARGALPEHVQTLLPVGDKWGGAQTDKPVIEVNVRGLNPAGT